MRDLILGHRSLPCHSRRLLRRGNTGYEEPGRGRFFCVSACHRALKKKKKYPRGARTQRVPGPPFPRNPFVFLDGFIKQLESARTGCCQAAAPPPTLSTCWQGTPEKVMLWPPGAYLRVILRCKRLIVGRYSGRMDCLCVA